MSTQTRPFEQTLAGIPSTMLTARTIVRGLADDSHPSLAERAEEIAGHLISVALSRTELWGEIGLSVAITEDGLRMTFTAPDTGNPDADMEGRNLAEVSKLADDWGTTRGDTHTAWAELRTSQAVTA